MVYYNFIPLELSDKYYFSNLEQISLTKWKMSHALVNNFFLSLLGHTHSQLQKVRHQHRVSQQKPLPSPRVLQFSKRLVPTKLQLCVKLCCWGHRDD